MYNYFVPFLFLLFIFLPRGAWTFAFTFAGEANGVDIVTHPIGYTGIGGDLIVTVGIDMTSVNAAEMQTSVQNVVSIINALVPTTDNLLLGAANDIPSGSVDFESTLLHEIGHSLGLAHVNAASESGLPSTDHNYTRATDGSNSTFNLDDGSDNIIGSKDDMRGDDVNLNYFDRSSNNPFNIVNPVDQTTYSRLLSDLPTGSSFSANCDRTAATSILGAMTSTECVMQQGAFSDEAQRTLGHDDVAGLKYAMAGIDEIAGTADDYTLTLSYVGLTNSADILIDFDNTQTVFAVSRSGGTFIGDGHIAITSNMIFFNDNFSWYFNDVALPIQLIEFGVEKMDATAIIKWTTARELNNKYVEIQRMTEDQNNWEAITRITPDRPDSYQWKSYSYIDDDLRTVSGPIYYRLKQVDLDEAYTYSAIRSIILDSDEKMNFAVYPNPFTNHIDVEIQHGLGPSVGSIRLFDVNGISQAQMEIRIESGRNNISIKDLDHLSSGVYILELTLNGRDNTYYRIIRQ